MKRFFCLLLCLLFISCAAVNVGADSAQSAVVIEADSRKVIYQNNANVKLPMASTTKIMTALILCEQPDMNKTVTVTPEMLVEGSSAGLKVGDEVPYMALLYGMLLSSGNDSANAVAIAISGSVEAFVELMNSRARQMGLSNTHFDTPSGLDGESHYTTAYELAVLTAEALGNPLFASVCSKQSAKLEYGGTTHYYNNHNRLLREYSGCIGVKTGYTTKAGRCLVSAATKNGITLIAVTLNDKNDWADHKEMLNGGFLSAKVKSFSYPVERYSLSVVGGTKGELTVSSSALDLKLFEETDVSKKVCLPHFLYAPVSVGDTVGSITYYCGTRVVAREVLVAKENIECLPKRGFFKRVAFTFKKLLAAV